METLRIAAVFLSVIVIASFSSVSTGQEANAEYFPSFADKHTVALWLFDETQYAYNALTDAGLYEYDLRLFEGDLVAGKFGSALKTSPGRDFNLYYAEWVGKICQAQMRQPDWISSGLWGPTMAPEQLLKALAGPELTIEFWVKFLSKPKGEVTILDMGHAYEPGFELKLDCSVSKFVIKNAYRGIHGYYETGSGCSFDGQWHHVALVWSATHGILRHYIDGCEEQMSGARVFVTAVQAIPETIVPSSFVRPVGYDLFDKSRDYEKFRKHRFNLSIGEDRRGAFEIDGLFDEFRISNVARYSKDFETPGTFSRNYGANAPKAAVANGPALLFAADSAKGVVKLGSRKHLFIDDAILDSKESVALVCNPPQKRTRLDFKPVESRWRPSVVDIDGKIYMFIPESYGSDRGNTRLRISSDGLNFTKPDLGIYEYEGSRHNDFVISLKPLYADYFRDLNPAVRAEEKYKMTAWLSNRGVYLYVSPDGIHWRRNETAMLPIKSGGDAETYWDDQRGVYVTFIRRDSSNYTEAHPGEGRAGVYFETRELFKTWPFNRLEKPYFEAFPVPAPTGEGVTIFKENATGEVYRTRAFKYPWAPDTYVAFPWRFKSDDETRRVDLGVSRDGINWKFYAGQKWYIEPPAGSVEVLSMYGIIRRGDEIWQYIDYGGAHGAGEREYARVVQRLDGFVSLDAGAEGGRAITVPLTFEGGKLVLNINAKGFAMVAITDENSKAIDGFGLEDCEAIKNDSVRHVVTWKGKPDLSRLAGKVVRLRFEMQDAKLFAFEFTE